jgi:diguanylate cyclase (GGDEF)-like protein
LHLGGILFVQAGVFLKQKIWLRIFITTGISLFALAIFDSVFVEAAGLQSNSPLLKLHDGQGEYLLGSYIEYLEDPSQTLNIERVSSQEYADKFIRGDVDILNFGLKNSAYWLRFTVSNESLVKEHWLLELARPSMNSVFLYSPTSNRSGFIETKTGYVFPFSTRGMPHESFIFNLDLSPGNEQTYYLRVKDMSLDLPLRIWSNDAFALHDQTSRLIIAVSFGALITMLIYNIILLVIMYDLGYVYYVVFQIFLLLFLGSIQGYAPRYLWPYTTLPNFFVIPLFIELSVIFLLLFTWEFLRLDSRAKWLGYLYRILIVLLAFSIPLTFNIGARILTVVIPLVLIALLYAFVSGVWAMLRGYKPARYYMFAWSVFLIIGFGTALQHMSWLTVKQIIPEQALQFGSVYLVIFQSLALADRINYYKQEHLNAQNGFILQQKETLRLKDELNSTLENDRDKLEKRVAQRTRELVQLNKQLYEEITERKHAEAELKRLASIDFLTGLFNRRRFFEIARQEFIKSSRYNRPLSALIFDLDLFKRVNDTHGHLVGDQALIHIGNLIRKLTRKTDIIARYGGEEFVILLPETDRANAQIFAERLRQFVQNSPVSYDDISIHLTISIGVSGKNVERDAEEFDQLISQADEALYKAKRAGRNKVICYWENLS